MITKVDLWEDFLETYYKHIRTKLDDEDLKHIEIDVKKDLIYAYEMRLAEELFYKPDTALENLREAIKKFLENPEKAEKIAIVFKNLPTTRRFLVKEIGHQHLNTFFAVEGIVRKVSDVRPMVTKAVYLCHSCGESEVFVTKQRVLPKVKTCPYCKKKAFEIDWDACETTNFQKIEIQDLPENLDSGEQPRLLEVALIGDHLVGKVRAGDKVRINGILRPSPKGFKKAGDHVLADFGVYLEANNIEFIQEDVRAIKITPSDVEIIQNLAKMPNIYNILTESFAPSLYGMDMVKMGIVFALFGSDPIIRSDGTRMRGDIHILLVGDPSVGKSQLLRAILRIAPRAIATTGYSSTGAGLTVAVVKDEFDRWTIEAGALILADKGICIVDELEKMSKEDRKYMLEALEQQTITISKAGINATLNARCTLIAGANPKRGRFDRYEPLVDQINIEPPLLSRFDLIYILLDEPNVEKDTALAEFILNNACEDISPQIDPNTFRKYIIYAKQNVTDVKLDKSALEKLKEFYISMRKLSSETETIAITLRQLEALIRLTRASARIRLSKVATIEDAERAINLFKSTIEQIAIDPESGNIDIDFAYMGISSSIRDKIAELKKIIEDLQETTKFGAKEEEIIQQARDKLKMPRDKVLELLQKMRFCGDIYCPRKGYYRIAKQTY